MPTVEAMAKGWLKEGAKDETEEAAVKGADTGTVEMTTGGRDVREVKTP